ncbi:MAG: hypothetical protein II802_01630 [Clostridia bacterium]|nr:hypothetical protein [Clostridia bacterium]
MLNRAMKTINNFSLKRLLYNKRFTVTLSCFLAFVFWLIIMINQNPVREQTFTDIPVNITLDNTVASENGMGIVGDLSAKKFSVTVSGPNYIVSSLKTEDFALYASAAEVREPGEYKLEVVGMRNSSKSGYTFASISPQTVDVVFDYIDTKAYTVTPKLIGVGASEGLVAETAVVSGTDSDTITIKGPRTVMDTIDSVVAYAEVNKTLSSSQTYDAQIIIYDKDGNEVNQENLTLSASTVKVSVPISKKATVRVKPQFSSLPSGISASSIKYSLSSSTVTIIGTPDVITSISEISLSPIDFTNVSVENNSFDVQASLPEGVKILDSAEYFTVTIDTSGYAEKTFNVSEFKFSNLTSGLTAKSASSIKNVTICGPEEVISQIKYSDIYAQVDLSDKSAGEHTVDAVIKSDTYKNIWQVGSYTATVRIN